MSSDWPRPQSSGMFQGEAITLWRVHRAERALCCFVAEWSTGFWLGIECSAGELMVSETLADLGDLLNRAEDLKRTYLADGWIEDLTRDQTR